MTHTKNSVNKSRLVEFGESQINELIRCTQYAMANGLQKPGNGLNKIK